MPGHIVQEQYPWKAIVAWPEEKSKLVRIDILGSYDVIPQSAYEMRVKIFEWLNVTFQAGDWQAGGDHGFIMFNMGDETFEVKFKDEVRHSFPFALGVIHGISFYGVSNMFKKILNWLIGDLPNNMHRDWYSDGEGIGQFETDE